jgi:hypothetical protein
LKTLVNFLLAVFMVLSVIATSFLLVSGVWCFVCCLLGLEWSWRTSFAVWSLVALIVLLIGQSRRMP